MPATMIDWQNEAHTCVMRWATVDDNALPLIGKVLRSSVETGGIAEAGVDFLFWRSLVPQFDEPVRSLRMASAGIHHQVSAKHVGVPSLPTLAYLYAGDAHPIWRGL